MHKNRHKKKQTNSVHHKQEEKKYEKEILDSYALSTDGRALARDNENKIVFVKDMLPNETAKVQILQKKSNFKLAKAISIEKPSPMRVLAPCPIFNSCGACQLQHLNESYQSEIKYKWFFETLKRIGKWSHHDIHFAENICSLHFFENYYYRRRIRVHFDGKKLGYHENQSNKIISVNSCLIAHRRINETLPKLQENLLDFQSRELTPLKIQIIQCEIELTFSDDNKIILHIAQFELSNHKETDRLKNILERKLEIQKDQSIILNHPFIKRFKLKKQSFIQPHKSCFKRYYSCMQESLKYFYAKNNNISNYIAWDLYAGSGVFTTAPYETATKFNKKIHTIAVEGIKEAIDSLNSNCKNLPNESKVLDVEKFVDIEFSKLHQEDHSKVHIVILDPPRSGCGLSIMQKIIENCAQDALILYLACDPASFARDTRLILEGGFKLLKLDVFDAFPHTTHYEVLGSFIR